MLYRFIRFSAAGAVLLAVAAVLGGFAFSQSSPSPNLVITSPAPDTVVHPGDTVNVQVAATRDYVAVYLVGDDPIGVSNEAPRTAPSYNLTIQIPDSIQPGSYRIIAVGALADGPPDRSASVGLDVSN